MSISLSSKLAEKLKQYTYYANDVLALKLIFTQDDLEEDTDDNPAFAPEYTHQIFGDDENIFGYKDLTIQYYLTPAMLNAYIGLSYNEKITPQRFEGIESDDVYDAFEKFGCSPGFTRNIDLFCSEKLKQDLEFKPFGKKIHEYTVDVKSKKHGKSKMAKNSKKFEIYKIDSTHDDYHRSEFNNYLQRVQTLLVFFIETASFVDTEDDQWTFYLMYEKKSDRYVTMGYLSVYNYYAYPDKIRSRISQMFILPTYQQNGHGAHLMECVYLDIKDQPSVIDITAESPSEGFVRIRDFVTCKMCLQSEIFLNSIKNKKPFNQELVKEILEKFKMPKLQSQRCYEILRLKFTNEHDNDEFKQYRLDIKKRLYWPFIRNSKFARNTNNAIQPETNDKCSSDKTKNDKFDSRFGNEGETTIGFGSAKSSTRQIKSLSFANTKTTGNSTTNGKKKVCFAPQSDESSDEEEEANASTNSDGMNQYTNLLINEKERKKYLEEQFQFILEDYKKTLKRLENY